MQNISFLNQHFYDWMKDSSNKSKIMSLNKTKLEALINALKSDLFDEESYSKRSLEIENLYQFDYELSNIFSDLINEKNAFNIDYDLENSTIFDSNVNKSDIKYLNEVLLSDGYAPSAFRLHESIKNEIINTLAQQEFKTKSAISKPILGKSLIKESQDNNSKIFFGGDTFWLTNQDNLINEKIFQEIAFDPVLLSIAGNYLGCWPIHVQTNAWFSFQSQESHHNLSQNAQLFHQDKEFIKFLKVFIYLTDVSHDQGPHCYVKGSHKEELNKKGFAFSQRLNQLDIESIYGKERISTFTGDAGSILFGDTSSVHRGMPVLRGSRLLLQLEYSSSLYLSPVLPFQDIKFQLPYDKNILNPRIIKNYNTDLRRRLENKNDFDEVQSKIFRLQLFHLRQEIKRLLFVIRHKMILFFKKLISGK